MSRQTLEPEFDGSRSILRVADDVDVLGFRIDFSETIASVSRGGCAMS